MTEQAVSVGQEQGALRASTEEQGPVPQRVEARHFAYWTVDGTELTVVTDGDIPLGRVRENMRKDLAARNRGDLSLRCVHCSDSFQGKTGTHVYGRGWKLHRPWGHGPLDLWQSVRLVYEADWTEVELCTTDNAKSGVEALMLADGISVVASFEKLPLTGDGAYSYIAKAAVVVAGGYSLEHAQHIADRLRDRSDLQALRWVFEQGMDFDSSHQEMLAHVLSTTVVDLQSTLRVWKLVDSANTWDRLLAANRARAVAHKPDDSPELRHFLGKALDAAHGGRKAWVCMSTGEKVAVALVLNKSDWLAEMDYSMPEAIERTGSTWVALMPAVTRALREAGAI